MEYDPENFPLRSRRVLTDDETIAAYLNEALEGDDPRQLYRALNESGNPELGTSLKVMRALGIRLKATLAA